MTGLECLERLRRGTDAKRPPALLFTADWDVADQADQIAELGGMFVSKLCDLEEVGRLVTSMLAAQSALTEPPAGSFGD